MSCLNIGKNRIGKYPEKDDLQILVLIYFLSAAFTLSGVAGR
jgi:hypothetical protein